MPTRLAAQFSLKGPRSDLPQLSRVGDIGPYGMSLTALCRRRMPAID